jgi:CspA family cold shock protein
VRVRFALRGLFCFSALYSNYPQRRWNKLAEGTVKWFDERKGYGFITQDDGPDVFVHHDAIKGNGSLVENDRVRFETVKSPKGLKAENVEKL